MTAHEYKDIRKALGSQGDVAKMLGITNCQLSRRENGKVKISKEHELSILYLDDQKLFNESFGDL